VTADGQTQEILTEKSFTIDDIVWRAIAKIAFNYLAYWQGTQLTLHPAFAAASTRVPSPRSGDSVYFAGLPVEE
jgi:hypothetical protein